ncbi:hypothetical protein ECG_02362 [Echinococcus granulosus]|nr:hypothetical protein ECG_02362 [Echinococcus granulosus]
MVSHAFSTTTSRRFHRCGSDFTTPIIASFRREYSRLRCLHSTDRLKYRRCTGPSHTLFSPSFPLPSLPGVGIGLGGDTAISCLAGSRLRCHEVAEDISGCLDSRQR